MTDPGASGVRDPRGPGILGTVDLAPGETIASSGGYEHRFEAGGKKFHHILDPRTGEPARGTAGTTVISRDAELADAAATALMVAGPARFAEIARRMGVDTALLVGRGRPRADDRGYAGAAAKALSPRRAMVQPPRICEPVPLPARQPRIIVVERVVGRLSGLEKQ